MAPERKNIPEENKPITSDHVPSILDAWKTNFLRISVEPIDEENRTLTKGWRLKNEQAKIFFFSDPETFMKIYEELNHTKEFNGTNWNKYANSQQLQNLVYDKMIFLSREGRQVIAYSEIADNYGTEIHTNEGAIYIAVPFLVHKLSPLAQSIMQMRKENMSSDEYWLEEEILNQVATRSFTTSLNHMFFAHFFNRPLRILKHEGFFVLDDQFNYQQVKK